MKDCSWDLVSTLLQVLNGMAIFITRLSAHTHHPIEINTTDKLLSRHWCPLGHQRTTSPAPVGCLYVAIVAVMITLLDALEDKWDWGTEQITYLQIGQSVAGCHCRHQHLWIKLLMDINKINIYCAFRWQPFPFSIHY